MEVLPIVRSPPYTSSVELPRFAKLANPIFCSGEKCPAPELISTTPINPPFAPEIAGTGKPPKRDVAAACAEWSSSSPVLVMISGSFLLHEGMRKRQKQVRTK